MGNSRPEPGRPLGRCAAGLGLALWTGLAPGCAAWDKAFHRQAAEVPAPASVVEVPDLEAPEADTPGDVQRALALADAGRPEVALALLNAALKAESVPEDEGLYWVAVLRLSPPISDKEGARNTLRELVKLHPDGARGRAAATLLSLLDKVEILEADNASLHKDLKRLLDIDVEAQRKRQEGTTTTTTP
jgi:tetratricopeptide (TPR) repeat protein